MPRGYKTQLTEEVINSIKSLHEQGMYIKEISKQTKVSYSKVQKILFPSEEKIVITSAILAELEKEIKTLSMKELSNKYHRSIGELRNLFKCLNWEIPENCKETNALKYKDEIKQYLTCNMSFKEIGDKIGLDRNKVYYIYNKYFKSEGLYHPKKKKEEEPKQDVAKTYQEILRETANSIKEKLRKQYA